ncbi:Hypp7690 [Branchiostoma lanceolatum]|uniref:Hypp7690 protein n=1 Tax=Branchiostoma lanceolatum TaxID=7740 RepID=A0A8K0EER0_BRALA|nr:Hypp7690 [Branchiostoma lanceolatum]
MPTRYALRMNCPVKGCSGANRVASGWVCSKDKDTMYIDEDGYLSCQTMAHRAQIVYWKFDCGQRGSGSNHNYERYQSADLEGFTHALSIGMAHLNEGGAVWLCKLITNIEKQYKG